MEAQIGRSSQLIQRLPGRIATPQSERAAQVMAESQVSGGRAPEVSAMHGEPDSQNRIGNLATSIMPLGGGDHAVPKDRCA